MSNFKYFKLRISSQVLMKSFCILEITDKLFLCFTGLYISKIFDLPHTQFINLLRVNYLLCLDYYFFIENIIQPLFHYRTLSNSSKMKSRKRTDKEEWKTMRATFLLWKMIYSRYYLPFTPFDFLIV